MMDRIVITYSSNPNVLNGIANIWREYDKKEGVENKFYRIEYTNRNEVSLD
jgi:hypothetical protein